MADKNTNIDPLENLLSGEDNNSESNAKSSDDLLGDLMSEISKAEAAGEITKKEKIEIHDFSSLIDLLENFTLYDFVTLEPQESTVLLQLYKDKRPVETLNISFAVYNAILTETKTKLGIPQKPIDSEAEAKEKFVYGGIGYYLTGKLVPSKYGEKIFLKLTKDPNFGKQTKKTNPKDIIKFFFVIALISIILGSIFIGFVVFTAKDIEDVRFFQAVGINLNQINDFIRVIVRYLFGFLVIIQTGFLFYTLFRAFLTKKVFRKKRLLYWFASFILMITTISTGLAWMQITIKVNQLPNWIDLSRGNVQIYNNSILTSSLLEEQLGEIKLADTALLTANESNVIEIIGPMTVKFDVSNLEASKRNSGINVKEYNWNIGDKKITTTLPELIYNFDTAGSYDINLQIETVNNILQEDITQVESFPTIVLNESVKIDKEILQDGSMQISLDGSSLKQRYGDISWYIGDENMNFDFDNPIKTFVFKPNRVFKDSAYIGLNIDAKIKDNLPQPHRLFIIDNDNVGNLDGEIKISRSPINDLTYIFSAENLRSGVADGGVKSFIWNIDGVKNTQPADPLNLEVSSRREFQFKAYGTHEIILTLVDGKGQEKNIFKKINIQKDLSFRRSPIIFIDGTPTTDYVYNNHEFFFKSIKSPTTVRIDTRRVLLENPKYILDSVDWDIGGGTSITDQKILDYEIQTPGRKQIKGTFTFKHRDVINSQPIILEETFIFDAEEKSHDVVLEIIKDSSYVPATVSFDASKSYIRGENVIKFEYDYGDGITETRDAINKGHIYNKPGNYTVKLTITGEHGTTYTTEKSLILKPEPQRLNISSSMLSAPVGQGIDFSSASSQGKIVEYFWEFGDGENSVEPNPTHKYNSPGEYKVTLTAIFDNKNRQTEELTIKILSN